MTPQTWKAIRWTSAAASALALAVLCAPWSASQEGPSRQLTGVVTGEGFTPIRIAVPDPEGEGPARAAAREIVETVRADLEFSGFFDVVSPTRYPLVPQRPGGPVLHDDWISIGADATVLAEVTLREGRIDLQARLFDNPAKSLLFARRYGGGTDLIRRVAHQLADDLVRHYTGRPGIAMSRIAFVSNYGEGRELYIMDYDGHRVRRITTTGTLNLSPAWAPDADRLAFVSWRGRRPGIWIMESDGRITSVPTVGGELNSAPDWSPDGRRLVYSSDVDGNSELYVVDLETGRNTRLTRTAAIETSPVFSPNGREIAFTSDRSGSPQIYIMDAEGLNVRRVSREGNYHDSPAWSPRGDRLAFVSRIDGRFEIVVLDLSSGVVTQLTSGGRNEDPRWSPDGRHIVFSSNRGGAFDIYSIRADGTHARRLTRGSNSYTPDWSR
jgi:TolB protein